MDPDYLSLKACNCLRTGSYQEARLLLERSLELRKKENNKENDKENINREVFILKNIADFLCGNLNYLSLLAFNPEKIQEILKKYNLQKISAYLTEINLGKL